MCAPMKHTVAAVCYCVTVRRQSISIRLAPTNRAGNLLWNTWRWMIQGYSKRSINFQEFILQVLLNMWWRAIYRLKGELSKFLSHLTSTRCEPHVRRGRCQIDNLALPTLVPAVDRLPSWRILSITCPKMSLHTWHWRFLGEFQHAETFLLCACRHFEHNTPWHTELLCAHLAGDSDQNF
jgi:hypothetical protein